MTTATPEADALPEHIGEVTQVWKCNSCEAITEDEPETPLYECGNDGTVFAGEEGNRCPDCNKFAARSEDGNACDSCSEGACEPVDARHCDIDDEWFEEGDEDEHLHDEDDEDEDDEPEVDATGAPTGGSKRDRQMRGNHPLPTLVRKQITEVVKGDVLAEPYPADSPGAVRARSGEGEPFRYNEIGSEPKRVGNIVRFGDTGVIYSYDDTDVVNVVTGWQRPESAVEINARDLTLSHLVLPAGSVSGGEEHDWRKRRGIAEITYGLADGTVTVTYGYSKRNATAEETYPAYQLLTVVDMRKPQRFTGKQAWEIALAAPLPRPSVMDADAHAEYQRVTEPIEAALSAALGMDINESRKVDNWLSGSRVGSAKHTGRLLIVARQRAVADKAIEVLREHGHAPVSLTSTMVDR